MKKRSFILASFLRPFLQAYWSYELTLYVYAMSDNENKIRKSSASKRNVKAMQADPQSPQTLLSVISGHLG